MKDKQRRVPPLIQLNGIQPLFGQKPKADKTIENYVALIRVNVF